MKPSFAKKPEGTATVDLADVVSCPTDGCPGDVRYAAPGRGHIDGCTYPLPTSKPAPTSANAGSSGLREAAEDRLFESLADWLGAQVEAFNITDPSDEQTTWIDIQVESLAERVLASDLLAKVRAEAKVEALREAEFEVRDARTLDPTSRAAVCAVLRGRADRIEAGEQP